MADERLFIGPLGAVADFAERVVPLLFAITLFVFLYQVYTSSPWSCPITEYQWIDAIVSYFGEAKNARPMAVAGALLVCASIIAVAGLTLSVGAASTQGQLTNSSDVVAAHLVADSVWVRANIIMLLILVTLPVLLNVTLLAMCVYALWKLQLATSKDARLVRAAVRMTAILSLMAACNLTRAVVVYFDVFLGAPPAVKYYLGYMVAEALPLIAILALAALALHGREKFETSEVDPMSDTPLLDRYDY